MFNKHYLCLLQIELKILKTIDQKLRKNFIEIVFFVRLVIRLYK